MFLSAERARLKMLLKDARVSENSCPRQCLSHCTKDLGVRYEGSVLKPMAAQPSVSGVGLNLRLARVRMLRLPALTWPCATSCRRETASKCNMPSGGQTIFYLSIEFLSLDREHNE